MTQLENPQSATVDTDRPALSVVVTIVSGARHLATCLSALVMQKDFNPAELEVIIPFDKHDADIAGLQSSFPSFRFEPVTLSIQAPPGLCHEHFDELRAAGLRLAQGRILALLEDHERPDVHWCINLLKAHEQSFAAVGGAVENDIDKPLNHATCFFDFGRYQNPLTAGPSPFLTDVNVGYKREAFNRIRHVWEQRFHEPQVHEALLKQGETLWLTPDVIVYQHREGLTLRQAIRERFIWGRYFAGKRVENVSLPGRIAISVLSISVPFIILIKMLRNVLSKRRHLGIFLKVLPVTLVLILFWYLGELTGYITGQASEFSDTRQTIR